MGEDDHPLPIGLDHKAKADMSSPGVADVGNGFR